MAAAHRPTVGTSQSPRSRCSITANRSKSCSASNWPVAHCSGLNCLVQYPSCPRHRQPSSRSCWITSAGGFSSKEIAICWKRLSRPNRIRGPCKLVDKLTTWNQCGPLAAQAFAGTGSGGGGAGGSFASTAGGGTTTSLDSVTTSGAAAFFLRGIRRLRTVGERKSVSVNRRFGQVARVAAEEGITNIT